MHSVRAPFVLRPHGTAKLLRQSAAVVLSLTLRPEKKKKKILPQMNTDEHR
jgi:hypothetical protein